MRLLLRRLFPGFFRAAPPPADQTDGPELYRNAWRLMQQDGLDGAAPEDILPALTQAYGKALAANHRNDIALTGLPLARVLGLAGGMRAESLGVLAQVRRVFIETGNVEGVKATDRMRRDIEAHCGRI